MRRRCVFSFGGVVFAWLLSWGTPESVFALEIGDLYKALKNSATDYRGNQGAICEDVAAYLYRTEVYPDPKYLIMERVAYGPSILEDRTGELDLVVMEKVGASYQVVEFAEVKCWKNLTAASNAAQKQKTRLYHSIKTPEKFEFYSLDTFKPVFTYTDLAPGVRFRTISQEGGRGIASSSIQGFDLEIPFSIEQLKGLAQKITQCQDLGFCKPVLRPKMPEELKRLRRMTSEAKLQTSQKKPDDRKRTRAESAPDMPTANWD